MINVYYNPKLKVDVRKLLFWDYSMCYRVLSFFLYTCTKSVCRLYFFIPKNNSIAVIL